MLGALALVGALASVMRPDPPLIIGAVYPTAGTQGSGGLEEFRGVKPAAEYANRAGGVRGKRLVVALAEAGSWDAAPYAIERLTRRGVRIVVGSYGSTVSVPAAETAAQLGMVFWETGAVAGFSMRAVPGERTFRFTAAGLALGRASVTFTRDQLATKLGRETPLRYAVTYVDDVYGRAVGEGAVQAVRESGLPLVAVLPYRLHQVDYDALAGSIARSGAEVLVVGAYLEDGVALRRAVVRARVPLLASIGTSSSHCMPAFGDMLGDDAVGLFASDKPDGDVLRADALAPDAAAALVWGRTAYRKRFGGAMTAPALTGFAGGLALFQHVLPRADGFSPEAVARGQSRRASRGGSAQRQRSGLCSHRPGRCRQQSECGERHLAMGGPKNARRSLASGVRDTSDRRSRAQLEPVNGAVDLRPRIAAVGYRRLRPIGGSSLRTISPARMSRPSRV